MGLSNLAIRIHVDTHFILPQIQLPSRSQALYGSFENQKDILHVYGAALDLRDASVV